MKGEVPVLNAADNPAHMARIMEFIELMRIGTSFVLNREPENLPHNQSLLSAAASIMAGMTVGHMVAVGVLREGDKARCVKMATVQFRQGVKWGLEEARKAMLEQLPTEGSS